VIYDDLHVVDLSQGIAGAYCTKLLTDLGADVVFTTPIVDPLFTYLRTSQRHATDPTPWLERADMVIVGEPGHAPAPAPAGAAPLVTVSITAVGHGGPDDGLVSTDEVLQARAGSLSIHGHPGQAPLTVGGHIGEYVTGVYAALAASTAWRRASRTGAPEVVDVSMLEAIQMTHTIVPTVMARFPGGMMGSFRWVMIPGNEPTGDGRFVGITTVTEAQWRALAHVIGRDDMAADEELGTMIGRFKRAQETNDALRSWTGAHTAEEVVDACVAARVPATIVGNGAELPRFDHVIEREVLVPQPGESWVRPRAPFRFHGVPDRELRAPDEADPGAGRQPRPQVAAAGAIGERPLAGVRVLDFTAFWAGPAATAWLAAMGADVIKVEAVQRADGIRFSAAVRPSQDPKFYEMSALFHVVNLGKRGITLDLGHPDGLALAKRLVERSDVVIENFTPRVLEQFGLDYAVVRGIRPDAVMVRMPAFGLPGPWRDRPGFAQTMEQITGMAWVTGYEGGPPIIPGGPVDPMVGAHAALAIVAALEHRDRTGEGQLVEVPLFEVASAVTAEQVIRYQLDGKLFDRRGTDGVYRVQGDDAWIAVDLGTDPMSRAERATWCESRTADDAVAELRDAGVPAAAMVPAFATLEDPQLQARGFFERIEHPIVGAHDYPTWPVRMSAGPTRYWSGPAPMLGQHTDEVLRDELGVTDDELARLRDAHVIGTEPYFG
jgi:crotonobetainyl-CoA:carnitine CoA-transferase CaiB-like acyl-CoA transferase